MRHAYARTGWEGGIGRWWELLRAIWPRSLILPRAAGRECWSSAPSLSAQFFSQLPATRTHAVFFFRWRARQLGQPPLSEIGASLRRWVADTGGEEGSGVVEGAGAVGFQEVGQGLGGGDQALQDVEAGDQVLFAPWPVLPLPEQSCEAGTDSTGARAELRGGRRELHGGRRTRSLPPGRPGQLPSRGNGWHPFPAPIPGELRGAGVVMGLQLPARSSTGKRRTWEPTPGPAAVRHSGSATLLSTT